MYLNVFLIFAKAKIWYHDTLKASEKAFKHLTLCNNNLGVNFSTKVFQLVFSFSSSHKMLLCDAFLSDMTVQWKWLHICNKPFIYISAREVHDQKHTMYCENFSYLRLLEALSMVSPAQNEILCEMRFKRRPLHHDAAQCSDMIFPYKMVTAPCIGGGTVRKGLQRDKRLRF